MSSGNGQICKCLRTGRGLEVLLEEKPTQAKAGCYALAVLDRERREQVQLQIGGTPSVVGIGYRYDEQMVNIMIVQ